MTLTLRLWSGPGPAVVGLQGFRQWVQFFTDRRALWRRTFSSRSWRSVELTVRYAACWLEDLALNPWLITDPCAEEDEDVVVQSKRTWVSHTFGLARDIGPVSTKAEHRAFYAALGFGHDFKKPPKFTKLAMALNLKLFQGPALDERR